MRKIPAPTGTILLAIGLTFFVSAIYGQPPRKEVEDGPNVPMVPVPPPQNPEAGNNNPANPVPVQVGTMQEELNKTTNTTARNLFRTLLIPYDTLQSNFAGGATFQTELLPFRKLPEQEFEFGKLDTTLQKSTQFKMNTGSGFDLIPFELMVLKKVDFFLQNTKTGLERPDQLNVALRAVAVAYKNHQRWVTSGKRAGEGWAEVGDQLKAQMLKLQRQTFTAYIAAEKYDQALEIGLQLYTENLNDIDIQKDFFGFQLMRAQKTLKNPSDQELLSLRETLLNYEQLPGKKDSALIATGRRWLNQRAQILVNEALKLDQMNQTAAALNRLRQAETIAPELEAIPAARGKIRGKVLYVGVAELPQKMSPLTAYNQAEQWAVELMFEGLLTNIPTRDSARYQPQLITRLPGAESLRRTVQLHNNVRWGKSEASHLTSADIRETLRVLQSDTFLGRNAATNTHLIDKLERLGDPNQLTLFLQHGLIDPHITMQWKVLPMNYLRSQGMNADDDRFAREPFGSGPYRYINREQEIRKKEAVVFRANTDYGLRTNLFGLPNIHEIRFVEVNESSIAEEVVAGQLHYLPDAPPALAQQVKSSQVLRNHLNVIPITHNRRISMLAINHRRPELQNEKFRQGIMAAIDREKILNDHFRSGDKTAHQALTGPVPLNSWATPKNARQVSLFRPGSEALFTDALPANKSVRLRLAFLARDPNMINICGELKAQIEAAGGQVNNENRIQIDLQPLDATRFREKVHLERDFDLALTHHEYADDWFDLNSLLDANAVGRAERNFLGYLDRSTNPSDADRRFASLLDSRLRFRNFEEFRQRTWDTHQSFNQRVPFVPLWQIDRFALVHHQLEIHLERADDRPDLTVMNPAVGFTNVQWWKLK
ncbi:MAG: ABC transporter substrate-binding protein [Zavarzinella sp.]